MTLKLVTLALLANAGKPAIKDPKQIMASFYRHNPEAAKLGLVEWMRRNNQLPSNFCKFEFCVEG